MTEDAYLVGLRLSGKKVVVVGGGTVAQRRLPLLLANGADVHVITRAATPVVEALQKDDPGITLELRDFRPGDLEGAWYVIAATDDPVVNAAIAAEADERRIFCVRADIAREGSAVTPATFEHDGLSVGVLAGGEHRRSAAIRSAIHEALQQGLVTEDMPGELTSGVALVGGGPGDPELITVRGRRLLARADVVVADRLAPQELLAELGPHVEVIDAAKIPYGRAMAQEAINAVLIERARAGKFVVRLKGGDPFVFARGYEEVLACSEAGIPVTVVPGVTSAIAVPALAGVPVTHRGMTHEFVVVSGHVAPGHPESLVNWDALAAMRGTIVLLMAVERIEQFAKVLLEGGRPADTPVLVVQHGTTMAQRTLHATLADAPERIRSEGIRPPAIIVIGPVAGFAG
ncbi:uroporphyrinogen-III C-methyltransferase [Mycolicibacterium smegmatis]|uniref:Multifunctional enzyme siroheme synthase Cysg n=2 Tax=Mycolicibacterium smegmatis (strain ATCC 700084 / mc(2)155) TaxID=246196 RepID=I7G8X9_MYCS2|nr:uroporphyrinogen-III C-methyltransferase [Mycolicibacterium smegmatis]ABK75012.1 uroporphyrin-III C-methyltransferase [Mycolicibacterium smegmatis MC2 155]AFP39024.1 putative multifunctional enzyme siroheme synthase Cysg [Mycolicibacterium smegmatis MC2 155]AIU07797.1 uroporphyrin-III C-methyltransferase [Mycolicibacterium smegmatis MC2 155]AIU14422.1 uroporphyrin-III C-methyltransferase [Mycolicibacterium smegmatis]AIU21045.1 uroporphyrin-III C-methyltransferase [Mycolicibacterium smegmati